MALVPSCWKQQEDRQLHRGEFGGEPHDGTTPEIVKVQVLYLRFLTGLRPQG